MVMRIDVITVLPKIFDSVMNYGIISRGIKNGKILVNIYDLHDFAKDKHRTVDDRPYGGGPGMVLKPEPIVRAINKIKKENKNKKPWIIYVSPQGKLLTQQKVYELYKKKWLVIICGRYEGIDERVLKFVNEEISIGDYILTGGEIPAMVLIDSVCRYVKGVVKQQGSLKDESFIKKFLDYPQYTRPYKFYNMRVPDVLLSGDHKKIALFRLKESIRNTYKKRPEIIEKIKLTKTEKMLLEEVIKEEKVNEN